VQARALRAAALFAAFLGYNPVEAFVFIAACLVAAAASWSRGRRPVSHGASARAEPDAGETSPSPP